jgi:hypothetical protein
MVDQRTTAEPTVVNGIDVGDQEDAATGKSRRARRADVSRADFIAVVAGWVGATFWFSSFRL